MHRLKLHWLHVHNTAKSNSLSLRITLQSLTVSVNEVGLSIILCSIMDRLSYTISLVVGLLHFASVGLWMGQWLCHTFFFSGGSRWLCAPGGGLVHTFLVCDLAEWVRTFSWSFTCYDEPWFAAFMTLVHSSEEVNKIPVKYIVWTSVQVSLRQYFYIILRF